MYSKCVLVCILIHWSKTESAINWGNKPPFAFWTKTFVSSSSCSSHDADVLWGSLKPNFWEKRFLCIIILTFRVTIYQRIHSSCYREELCLAFLSILQKSKTKSQKMSWFIITVGRIYDISGIIAKKRGMNRYWKKWFLTFFFCFYKKHRMEQCFRMFTWKNAKVFESCKMLQLCHVRWHPRNEWPVRLAAVTGLTPEQRSASKPWL